MICVKRDLRFDGDEKRGQTSVVEEGRASRKKNKVRGKIGSREDGTDREGKT